MKQILQNLRTGELALREVPAPACPPGHVLVKTAYSFVSPGTERAFRDLARSSLLSKARQRPDQVRKVIDRVRSEGLLATLEKVRTKLEEPVPLGYSSAGCVIECGAGVEHVSPGSWIACAGAGYANHAEMVCVPRNLVVPVPDGVSVDEASCATLCSIAMQGVRVGEVVLGEIVGVIGLGLLGQITIQLLRAAGCRVFGIDVDERMVQQALAMGADQAVHRSGPVEDIALSMSGGQGLDAVIVTAASRSNDPVELAGRLARKRGRIIAVGDFSMEIPRRTYYPKELQLRLSTSYGPGRYDPSYEEKGQDYPYAYVRFTEQRNMASCLDLMRDGRLKITPLISHRYPFNQALEAYQLLDSKSGERPLGILLDYGCAPQDPIRQAPLVTIEPPEEKAEISPIRSRKLDSIRLGILGAGQFAAGVLLPRIAKIPGVKMARLVTARGASAEATARRFGIPGFSCQEEDLYSDPGIDAILIATRHHLHASQVIRALRSGKHVFVEKPLAMNLQELEEIAQVVEETGLTLMVGFNRRYAPLSSRLKAWFSPREWPLCLLGRINAGRLPEGSWLTDPEIGGGRILGEVCHFVDLFHEWTGSSVSALSVQGLGSPTDFPHRSENIQVLLGFRDGSQAVLIYSSEGGSSLGKEWYEVHGGNRSAVLDDFRTLDLYQGTRHERIRERHQDKGHTGELEDFFSSLKEGRSPRLDFFSCLASSKVTCEIQSALNKPLG
ncbi:Gfo/Idh/MocA family oxidoreductase [bacterium]|nr:Gfo/Idh/MocA family oxidoreductase [bacterium]